MRRPGVRQINQVNRGYSVPDVHTRYLRLKRQTAAAAALLLLLGGGSFLYFMAPQPAMASMFAWKELPEAPTLDTGASFSVTIASLDSSDGAGYAAGRVRTLGFPSFTQSLAGPPPAASGDGRAVSRHSMKPSACSAGSRVRVSPARGSSSTKRFATRRATRSSPTSPRAIRTSCCIGAPDRLSLVFELPLEPRQVRERRDRERPRLSTWVRCPTQIQEQQWSAPEGVHLVERVSIEGVQASETGRVSARARDAAGVCARPTCAPKGRRVYIDLTWPMTAPEAVTRAPPRRRPRRRHPRRASPGARSPARIRRRPRSMRSSCVAWWSA